MIDNYRELRHTLEAKGAVLRTQSDTEVLLHLDRQHGERMGKHLRDMFAFAIWRYARTSALSCIRSVWHQTLVLQR